MTSPAITCAVRSTFAASTSPATTSAGGVDVLGQGPLERERAVPASTSLGDHSRNRALSRARRLPIVGRMPPPSMVRRGFPLAVAGLVLAAATVVLRRREYAFGPRTFVRCRQGHVFTTIWIPGASLKAVRLGWWRLQRCPVGKHWALVAPVKPSALTDEERRSAEAHRDVRVP